MAQVVLNQAQVEARFQQVGGVAMAQGVHMRALGDATSCSAAESTLHTAARHWATIMRQTMASPCRVGAGNNHSGERCVRQCARSSFSVDCGNGT